MDMLQSLMIGMDNEEVVDDGETRVADLIATLLTLPPDLLVVLSRDPEGNRISPMDSYNDEYLYHDGELYDPADTDEDAPPADAEPCLVLWPTT